VKPYIKLRRSRRIENRFQIRLIDCVRLVNPAR